MEHSGERQASRALGTSHSSSCGIKCTYVVGLDDQLNDVLGVFVQDLHCCPRNQGSEVLWEKK